MIILIGQSGSGKTQYFLKQNKEYRILHVDNLKSLRSSIQTIYSPFIETKPTLINTWFDLDVSAIIDLKDYDVFIETHYFETDTIKIVSKPIKRYWGVYNEVKLKMIKPKSVIYFPPPKTDKRSVNLLELFGTRYNWIKSQLPDIMG